MISSTYALKLKEIISEPLTHLFNKSLSKNEIPLDWKKANVTPIFKKGNRSSVENYRPVSLTVIFGKTLERIIKGKIEEFLNANSSITKSQHGFSKGRSCLSNLLVCNDSSSSSSSSSSSFYVYHSLVHTKARVRRYQLMLDLIFGTTDCGLNESRMPFRHCCILLFDSVVDSVRIQNHYHCTKEQTGGHA